MQDHAAMYEVTGKLKDGSPLPPKIVMARGKRDAMLQVLRELGKEMSKVVDIDAVSV